MNKASKNKIPNNIQPSASRIELGEEHVAAVNRPRRLLLHYDFQMATMRTTPWGQKGIDQLDEILDYYMSPYEDANTEFLDTIVYELGHVACWPSRVTPRTKVVFPEWWEAGIDPLEKMIEGAKQKGREVFLTYRLNGTDIEEDSEYEEWKLPASKQQHPERLIKLPWGSIHLWNFAYHEVHDLKVSILREVAEMYDIDGLQVDLSRSAILFPVKAHFQLKQSQARVNVSARHRELFNTELGLYGLPEHRQMTVTFDPTQTWFDVEQCRGYPTVAL